MLGERGLDGRVDVHVCACCLRFFVCMIFACVLHVSCMFLACLVHVVCMFLFVERFLQFDGC